MERWIAPNLNVPLYPQKPNEMTCVPVCIKMVLEYLKSDYNPRPTPFPELSIDEIIKILKTDITFLGTSLKNIRNLNEDERVHIAVPSLEFEGRFGGTLDEIKKELANNRPVIVYVPLSETHTANRHAIVITGIDEQNFLIRYNDPLFGAKCESIVKFQRQWDIADHVIITVKIGARKQRLIKDFYEIVGSGKK